jgi:hypothetical protein
MVRAEGLEPPRLSSREPKSRASTSSATPAKGKSRDASGAAIWQGLDAAARQGKAANPAISGGGLISRDIPTAAIIIGGI